MTSASPPLDEADRLEALHGLALLDTPPEERFDRITRLATRLFGVPVALVSLVDEDRQWFKSRVGLAVEQTGRDVSFCSHAILEDDVLVVPDALLDERFADNPLVTDAPGIRFYAGYPLRTATGQPVGTLCLIDHRPRDLDATERSSLVDLGRMVEGELASTALANTDSLTGVRNRRGFEVAAAPMLSAATRMGIPVTLIFIDLDGFKAINDTHGHAEGDRGLKEIAAILLDVFRSCDVVARIGGDEFCILLSGTDEAQIQQPLARLASEVGKRNRAEAKRFDLNYSTGVVSLDGEVTTMDLLAEADRRMYRDKRRSGAETTQRELAQVLLELAGSLTDPAPRHQRVDRLCRQAVELLGCDRSSIFRWEGDGFRAAHNYGNPSEIVSVFTEFRVAENDPLVSAAFETRSCVAVNDAANSDLMNSKTARIAGIRSIVIAPMSAGDEPLGFMTAEYNERSGVFSELDATLLLGISRLVAGVIQAGPDSAI